LRFPEIFRDATKQGANLITIQAAWPAKRRAHWETLLKARAIENQVYIAAVNAVSTTPDQKAPLAGSSLIITPNGDVITQGPTNEEAVLSAELDLQAEKNYRKSFPVLDGIVHPDLI
jgi:predicted amidohydrolase